MLLVYFGIMQQWPIENTFQRNIYAYSVSKICTVSMYIVDVLYEIHNGVLYLCYNVRDRSFCIWLDRTNPIP